MRNGLIKELRVTIGLASMSVHAVRGWKNAAPDRVAEFPLPGTSTGQITAALDQAFADTRHRGWFASIVVADELVRLFIVPPPRNARGLRDLRAAAAMRFHTLYEAPKDEWQIEADWNPDAPFVACAMQRALLAGLAEIAAKRRIRLIGIAPRFIVSWNRWHAKLQPGAWFGAAHDGVLMLAPTNADAISALRPFRVPASARNTGSWLPEQVQREALRLNLPSPGIVQVCGELPAGWASRTVDGIALQRLHDDDSVPQPAMLQPTRGDPL